MAGAEGKQKTHDRCQPWVLVEIVLNATSPGSLVSCDDHQHLNLQRDQIHCGKINRQVDTRSSADSDWSGGT